MGLQLYLLLCLLGLLLLGIPGLLLAGTAGLAIPLAIWTFKKAMTTWQDVNTEHSPARPVTHQKECDACGELIHQHARVCCFCGHHFTAETAE